MQSTTNYYLAKPLTIRTCLKLISICLLLILSMSLVKCGASDSSSEDVFLQERIELPNEKSLLFPQWSNVVLYVNLNQFFNIPVIKEILLKNYTPVIETLREMEVNFTQDLHEFYMGATEIPVEGKVSKFICYLSGNFLYKELEQFAEEELLTNGFVQVEQEGNLYFSNSEENIAVKFLSENLILVASNDALLEGIALLNGETASLKDNEDHYAIYNQAEENNLISFTFLLNERLRSQVEPQNQTNEGAEDAIDALAEIEVMPDFKDLKAIVAGLSYQQTIDGDLNFIFETKEASRLFHSRLNELTPYLELFINETPTLRDIAQSSLELSNVEFTTNIHVHITVDQLNKLYLEFVQMQQSIEGETEPETPSDENSSEEL